MELSEVGFQWLNATLPMNGSQPSQSLLRFQLSVMNYILNKFIGDVQLGNIRHNHANTISSLRLYLAKTAGYNETDTSQWRRTYSYHSLHALKLECDQLHIDGIGIRLGQFYLGGVDLEDIDNFME